MAKERYFFQDYLFRDMPVDEQDNPQVVIKKLPENHCDIKMQKISLDRLLRMDRPEEWEKLYSRIENQEICIVDDVVLENDEMQQYKRFYLYSYYYNLMRHSKNTYVMEL